MRQSTELLNGSSEVRAKPTNGHAPEVFGQAMELDDQVGGGDDWDRMDTEEVNTGTRYQDKLNETLRYAQELKFEYKDDPSREVKDTLQSIFALFAYEDPRRSPTAPVMDDAGRVPVAEELNSAILGTTLLPRTSFWNVGLTIDNSFPWQVLRRSARASLPANRGPHQRHQRTRRRRGVHQH